MQVYLARYAEIDWESGTQHRGQSSGDDRRFLPVSQRRPSLNARSCHVLKMKGAFNDPSLGAPLYWWHPRRGEASRMAIPIASHRDFPVVRFRSKASAAGVSYIHLPIEDDEPVPVRPVRRASWTLSREPPMGHCARPLWRRASAAPQALTAAYMHAVGYKGIERRHRRDSELRPFIHPSSTLLNSVKEHLQ